MYKATTPTVTFTFPDDVDMTSASDIYVTFTNLKNEVIINKSGDALDVTTNTVSLFLSQSETLLFPAGTVKAQINWTYEEAGTIKRACTDVLAIAIRDNLYQQEILEAQQ